MVTIPLTRMKAEKSSPMAVSPTPKAALIWSLLPRTMYWSIPSMKRVNPMTHMGQLVTSMRRGAPTPGADRASPMPVEPAAGAPSGVRPTSAVLTTGSSPAARRSPPSGPQPPGVYPAGSPIDFISKKLSRPSGPNSRPTPDSL